MLTHPDAPLRPATNLDRAAAGNFAPADFAAVRAATLALVEPMAVEDTVVQTMPDVSPTKWHLAHTTWFFEHFVLTPYLHGYRPYSEPFHHLFNSYYYSVGQMHRRPERGFLSRPTLAEIVDYREHVDAAMQRLLADGDDEALAFLIQLGLNHEQQHQELILTDIKHVLSCNPLKPALRERPVPTSTDPGQLRWIIGREGLTTIGHDANGYAFDNETPTHQTLLHPHALASRPVTNAEYRAFIRDGGYRTTSLWLSDGWATVLTEGWQRPIYWHEDLDQEFTLGGLRTIDPHAPVCHLSFYEADAFASWAGARLPSEAELESATSVTPINGNFVESGLWHPTGTATDDGLTQLYGDVWEWTASPYAPYPGFKPLAGSLGEYNGKFMCNQLVLRGGSCATPRSHIRPTYRNFFYPQSRWQFSGIRLAKDH